MLGAGASALRRRGSLVPHRRAALVSLQRPVLIGVHWQKGRKLKICGHCRFSFYGFTDTGRAIQTVESAFLKLWHPVRMAVRFHLLETICLPAIRAQTDPDFTLVITTSKMLPEPFQDRLDRITSGIPQVRVLRTERTDLSKALKPVMAEASDDFTHPSVHFRIDDDDAVSTDYVARLRLAAQRMDPGGMITFPSGVLGFLDGEVARHCTFRKPSIAIGLALVNPPQFPRQPFQIQHMRHSDMVPCFSDPTFPAYHYTLHSANNTSGYEALFHTDGAHRRRIRKSIEQNAELAAGLETTTRAEAAIAQAFPHTTGPALREAIRRAADPLRLVEEMGFQTEPFLPD
ncbi:MAG: hypothetical protein C0524_01030 [Rhodobacter sp.]|nr:hypothetical protein [Rhodobacter sp.]